MKKIIAITLTLITAAFSLCACGKNDARPAPSDSSLMSDAKSVLDSATSALESGAESARDKVSEYREYMDESVNAPSEDVMN